MVDFNVKSLFDFGFVQDRVERAPGWRRVVFAFDRVNPAVDPESFIISTAKSYQEQTPSFEKWKISFIPGRSRGRMCTTAAAKSAAYVGVPTWSKTTFSALLGSQTAHGFYKVIAKFRIQPSGADDNRRRGVFQYCLFSGQFGAAVNGLRIGCVSFDVGTAVCTVKDVVGGDVNQRNAGFGQIFRAPGLMSPASFSSASALSTAV